MTDEEKEIQLGNMLISTYLYGEPETKGNYQIGYRNMRPIYRGKDEMYSEYYDNFHNNWNLFMNVVSKIAKDRTEEFSAEEIVTTQLKNAMFEYSCELMIPWMIAIRYIKLKLTI